MFHKKPGVIIGRESLATINQESKVQIKIINKKNQEINDYGYILKVVNKNCYEVWCEQQYAVLILSPEEIFEFKESDG